MFILNFSHPLTGAHLAKLEQLVGQPIERIVDVPTQFDPRGSFAEQVRAVVGAIGLDSREWQTTAIIINPPGLATIACVLLAELHGRIGHFPALVRLSPVPASVPPDFELAEIINLQAVRDDARSRR